MLARAFLAFPMAGLWLALSSDRSLGSFVVGYVFGFAVLYLALQGREINIRLSRLPDQLVALVLYTVILFWDILISSFDVARRVLDPRCPMSPGIIDTSTQDETGNTLVAALSMHAITVTPGEMVVGYDEKTRIMSVHCINSDAARLTLESDQAKRLNLIRRILGDV